MKNRIFGLSVDIFFLVLLILAGYSLIGFYLQSNYLATGYQDWIYHAFRIKSLSEHGLVSWDHIWSNGINHWQGYPFGVHYIVLAVVALSSLSITQAMLFVTVVAFILLRIGIYLVLRFLNIKPFYAFFASIVSYAFAHQWIAISDFSFFIVLLVVPLFVYFASRASEQARYFYLVAALSGFLWSAHPVVGYSLTGLFLLLVLFRKHALRRGGLIAVTCLFLCSFSVFFSSQFLNGYSYANPSLSTPEFWNMTISSPYFGLSLLYLVLLGLGWGIMVVRTDSIPRWAKIIHFFCTVYLFFIWTSVNGYLPGFGSLQLSRAITVVGFLLPFSLGALLHGAVSHLKSRFVPGILIAIMAVAYTNAIELSSQFSGQPVASIENPVAKYFGPTIPRGSIYTDEVSEASYFGNSRLRYVTSYNEHREPHPLGIRYKNLMRTDSAYTGVTQKQVNLINAYSQVLGVEYIFIPELSPLVESLSGADIANPQFSFEQTVRTKAGVFVVLRARYPISNAYIGEDESIKKLISFRTLVKPTLYADSYHEWDEEVLRLKNLIDTGALVPVPLTFSETDRLIIDTSDFATLENPSLLITQSYDNYWQEELSRPLSITPTSLRFMYVSNYADNNESSLILKNQWPAWHWVVQGLSIANVIGAGAVSIFTRSRKEKV